MRLYGDFVSEMDKADLFETSLWRLGDRAPRDKPRAKLWERVLSPVSCEFLCHLFDLREFKVILEIGRAAGHSLGLFRWLAPDATIVSVDSHPQEHAVLMAEYGDPELERTYLIDKPSDQAFIDGDIQKHCPYDLALIDGGHDRPQVRSDWQNVQRVVQPDAVVIFDDIQYHGPAEIFNEIKYRSITPHVHVRVPRQNRGRIGVVFMGGEIPGGLTERKGKRKPILTQIEDSESVFADPADVLQVRRVRGGRSVPPELLNQIEKVVVTGPAADDSTMRNTSVHVVRKRPKRARPPKRRRVEKPVPVDYNRRLAICCVGDGLGNVIEQSCMIQAVISMYSHVDVWMPRSGIACVEALRDLPGIRHIWREKQPHPPGKRPYIYDAVFHSFLIGSNFLKHLQAEDRFTMPHPTRGRDRSEAELATRAARLAGFKGPTPQPYCGYDPYPGAAIPRPLLGLCTGGNNRPMWRKKRYKRWEEVVDYLHGKLPELHMVLLGIKTDDPLERDFVIDLRGKTPFREAAGLIRDCDVFLANDNGLSHTAAALGVRAFTLFGPTLIGKNAPIHNTVPIYHRELGCRPCQYSRLKMGHRLGADGKKELCSAECMRELDPVMIGNHVLRYLGHEQLCDLRDGTEWYPVFGHYDEPVQEVDGSA